jgi:hypothetical protein
LIARRAGESSIPFGKRLWTTIIASVPSAVVTASAAIFGGWIALDARLTKIEVDHLEVVALMREKSTLREEQIRHLTEQMGAVSTRVIQIEERERARDSTIAECRAFVQRELAESRRR